MIISVLLAVVSIYTTSALTYHEVKVEKRQHWVDMATENKHGYLTKIICILYGVICLFRNINAIAFLTVEFLIWSMNTTDFTNTTVSMVTSMEQDAKLSLSCQVLPTTGKYFTFIGVGLTYCFLWIRMKIFFVHPRIKTVIGQKDKTEKKNIYFFISIIPFAVYIFLERLQVYQVVC